MLRRCHLAVTCADRSCRTGLWRRCERLSARLVVQSCVQTGARRPDIIANKLCEHRRRRRRRSRRSADHSVCRCHRPALTIIAPIGDDDVRSGSSRSGHNDATLTVGSPPNRELNIFTGRPLTATIRHLQCDDRNPTHGPRQFFCCCSLVRSLAGVRQLVRLMT